MHFHWRLLLAQPFLSLNPTAQAGVPAVWCRLTRPAVIRSHWQIITLRNATSAAKYFANRARSNTEWTTNQMQTAPLIRLTPRRFSDRGLTNQISARAAFPWILPGHSWSSYNGATAALFYGFKPDIAPPPGLPQFHPFLLQMLGTDLGAVQTN